MMVFIEVLLKDMVFEIDTHKIHISLYFSFMTTAGKENVLMG